MNPAFSLRKAVILPDLPRDLLFSYIDDGLVGDEGGSFLLVSPGFLAPSVSGRNREMGMARACNPSPRVKANQGSFFMSAAAIGGPIVKHSMFAAPSRKNVEALDRCQYCLQERGSR